MKLKLQSENMVDYLQESEEINYSNTSIQALIVELFHSQQSDIEKIQTAFHYVRDVIAHYGIFKVKK